MINVNLWTSAPKLPSLLRWAFLFLALALAGCSRDEIEVYQVAKEANRPDPHAGHDHAAGTTVNGGMPKLQWVLPPGWEESPPGEMRLASFKINGEGGKQADLGVFPLPGLAGGDLGNVNRWRDQVGLEPVTEEELGKITEPIPLAGQPAKLYDMAGENAASGEKTRILAAIQNRDGVAWFYKMIGDDDLVAKNRSAFVEFLKTLQFTSPTTELPPSHPPIDGMASGGPVAGSGAASGPRPEWQVPPGWQEVPGGSFLVAKFNLGEGDQQAAVNVSMSSGDGGGLAGNVNRWRQQLALEALPEAEIHKQVVSLEAAGGKAMLVDFGGKDGRSGKAARTVGAIVPQEGRTWFYKLMGSEAVVASQKDAFIKFVQTARYPNAS